MTEAERFDVFWALYPRKVGKRAAWKVWRQLPLGPKLDEQIRQALAWQVQQPQWLEQNGQYIPHPVTWLRQGRWDDEPVQVESRRDRVIRRFGIEF